MHGVRLGGNLETEKNDKQKKKCNANTHNQN